ncbi:MAG: ATP-dependent Clp protease proteolytic subunit [Phycisphaeraceae bacterium]|nr:ATP-dependent Clp protease proteolytic subunit [Phycisphaeraceae bacterium]
MPIPLRSILRSLTTAVFAFGVLSVALGEPDTEAKPAATAAPAAAPKAVPAARQAKNVAIITIHGPIDEITAASFERRLKLAEQQGADAVVIDLDTPGGAVPATLDICTAIKRSPIANTVAWVNPQAYSAGAIIALACREIVVVDYATMGDAAPIAISPLPGLVGGGLQALPATERAKILAPVLAEVTHSARLRGYDERLVESFVTLGVDLWLVEENSTGRFLLVDQTEHDVLFGDATADAPAPPGQNEYKFTSPDAQGAVFDEQMKYVDLPPSERRHITLEDRGEFTLIEHLVRADRLTTLKTDDLIRTGLAKQVVRNDPELQAYFGATNLKRVGNTWSESLVRVMRSFPVMGLLVVVFLVGLFIEMSAPGVGLAGGAALLALIGLIAPAFLIDAAGWWHIAAIIAGLGLIAAELFVIPGFGIAGIAGVLVLFAGLLGIMVGAGGLFPDSPQQQQDMLYGLATIVLSLATAIVIGYFVSRKFGTLPMLNRLVLTNDPPAETVTLLGAMGRREQETALRVGDEGVAATPLRPSGRARFGDRLVDVVCDIGMANAGDRVRIIEAGKFRTAVEVLGNGNGGAGA